MVWVTILIKKVPIVIKKILYYYRIFDWGNQT